MSFLHAPRRALFTSSLPRRSAAAPRRSIPIPSFPTTPFPVIESCPAPTCECRPYPQFPEDLPIDRKQNLNGTMAAYGEQILIATGKDDWTSKIEDDENSLFQRQLRDLLVRNGELCDPYHNVMITNSSFAPASRDPAIGSAYLFPSFRYLPRIPLTAPSVRALVKGFVKPRDIHPVHKKVLPAEQQAVLARDETLQREFEGVREVDEVVVLICGHGGRDARCGVLGPVLRDEFGEKLQKSGIVLRAQPELEAQDADDGKAKLSASVGLISHIGGHKYAGNVIVYIPKTLARQGHPLAGKGVWYGRVGPEQVEGVVSETIVHGRIIKELFRGGIEDTEPRSIIRL
ncbi:uncharacterized protein K452DRAFT_291718 [Aplosporella prunicola CBS 121167]|uniref:Altered inheritance of mitochondria protein 32 n=1 Tax=Aplosporella prunicola CBS 121167 TaxID=1176127 RepID=A0A6A6AZW0_9PEZI|nr:uncharacterized protein K452DRAFT_291718 [Aplosporella prunicola CBS 121167]KAF2137330.1 hypothetical protein K452DRAFT_291718 [Aplosporella prunicola CBS 121167]